MFHSKSVFLGIILFFSIFTTFSQTVIRCYTDENHQQLMQQFPELETTDQFEQWMQQQLIQNQASAIIGGVYYIPVVVHVIHNGEAVGTGTNVSFAAIQSQIDVLNEDFRKILGSNGWNTHPDGADTQIEFCLAQRRPDGSAFPAGEPGVNRINRNTVGFTAPPYSQAYMNATIKAYTYNNNAPTATRGWDPAKYMNIWLANLSGGLLGYAQFPQSPLGGMGCGNQAAGTDGVVFLYNSIGKSSVTGFTGVYNEGRTATHEVGHWLGLRHIWGDGGCTVDDFCNDTPEAGAANYGCPVGTNSCTAAPDAGVDMIENYMDYTDDLCMNIFTNDQKMRMRTVLENSPLRASLINSDACTPPLVVDASVVDIINPKGDNCIGSITPSVTLKNRGSGALTNATISYKIDNGAPTTFAWSGNLASGATVNVTLPAFTTTAGQHMFKAYSTLPNGSADQATAYDTSGISFVVSPGISAPFTETFDGGTFPPDVRWVVENPTNDCFEWVGASATSINGVFNNNAAQFPGFGNNTGQTENLITPIFTLPCNATAANLQFDVAYRRRNTTTANYERLYVEISENCGATWNATPIYDKTGTALQVLTNTLTTYYTPVGATDWRTETINLLPFVTTTSKNVKFRIRAVAANGNNIYIDNLKFNATTPGEISLTQSGTNIFDEGFSNLGSVTAGTTSTVTYTITNTGTSNLTLNGPISVTGTGFTLGSTFGSTTVPAGGSTTFTVVFSPSASANYSGNLSFGTNDCDEALYNFQLNGIGVTNPPVAGFTPSATVICVGQTVTFTNTSNNATSYTWNFGAGATPATSTDANPTVTFNTLGTYTATLTATNAFGNDVETQTNVINVLDGTGISLPVSEGFTTTTFPPTNWSLINANNSPTTWARSATVGNTPTAGNSMIFDNFNYNDGDDDQVRLPGVNLTGYSTSQLQFDVAYAPYNANNFDGLEVLVSTNCGATWTSVFTKSNTTLATAAATTASFVPTATQWRTETVNLTPYVGNSKVIVSFKNLSGYGNNLYVDNINLTGVQQSVPPVASFTPSATTICAGQSVTFTNTSTGNPTSYSWSFPGGNPTSSAATSPTVSYVNSGTYTVSLTATNASGSNTATQTIVVNANPTVTASNQTICAGSSATLQAVGTPSGGTYSWSNGGSGPSILVTPTSTTTYSVTYTVNGCSATQASVVTVTPPPVVTTTSATICAGGTATLSATANPPGGVFTWSTGATGTSISVSPTTTTNYTVNYSVNGCNSAPVTAQVVVNQAPTVSVNNATICSGTTTTLIATPSITGGSYSWSTGAITQQITVAPTVTTTYSVTYTAAGCSPVSAAGIVTVNSTPTVTASNQTICSGSTATLQAAGTPSGGTYSWSNGGTGSSITVTPTATTTYTVTYTVNGCSATQASIVTVIQLPVVISTSATICAGGTATLSATANPPGGVFTWSTGATGTSITVSPTTTTNYTVNYSVNGCNSTPVTAQVVVNQNPTITVNSATICEGNTTTLTATPSSAGGVYLWSTNGNTASVTVSPLITTSYTVTYTLSGCAPATASGTVTVSPSPMVNLGADTTICAVDFPYTLTASVSGANNQFTWSTGDQTQSITISTGGTYTVNVTNSSGCSASDVIQIISDPCASMEQLDEWKVKVYPNPTAELVMIESNEILEHIYIFDSNGKLVFSSNGLGNTFSFDVSKLVTGVYELKLVNANSVVWKKLIKH
jgi:PKD repeat protein